jgi:IclR family pca regulon transcriptional regulator
VAGTVQRTVEHVYRVQSLQRGAAVLRCFTSQSPQLSLTDIVGRTGIPKPTAFRTLLALCESGLLDRDPATRKYHVGVCALDLCAAFLEALRLPGVAMPHLERLAHECMESASMAILDGVQVVYVARAATRRWMSAHLQVGSRLPAYCTSLGRVLLAYRPWRETKALLARERLLPHTPKTVTDLGRLAEILAEVRVKGYSINDEELELGLRSAAAPIRLGPDKAFAAVNVSTPSARVSLGVLVDEFVPKLVQTARSISEAMEKIARVGVDVANLIRQ